MIEISDLTGEIYSFYLLPPSPNTGDHDPNPEIDIMTKTASFAIVHFSVAFSVGYLLSGSLLVGGAIALVEPTINTVAYHFHEKVWQRLESRAGPTQLAM